MRKTAGRQHDIKKLRERKLAYLGSAETSPETVTELRRIRDRVRQENDNDPYAPLRMVGHSLWGGTITGQALADHVQKQKNEIAVLRAQLEYLAALKQNNLNKESSAMNKMAAKSSILSDILGHAKQYMKGLPAMAGEEFGSDAVKPTKKLVGQFQNLWGGLGGALQGSQLSTGLAARYWTKRTRDILKAVKDLAEAGGMNAEIGAGNALSPSMVAQGLRETLPGFSEDMAKRVEALHPNANLSDVLNATLGEHAGILDHLGVAGAPELSTPLNSLKLPGVADYWKILDTPLKKLQSKATKTALVGGLKTGGIYGGGAAAIATPSILIPALASKHHKNKALKEMGLPDSKEQRKMIREHRKEKRLAKKSSQTEVSHRIGHYAGYLGDHDAHNRAAFLAGYLAI